MHGTKSRVFQVSSKDKTSSKERDRRIFSCCPLPFRLMLHYNTIDIIISSNTRQIHDHYSETMKITSSLIIALGVAANGVWTAEGFSTSVRQNTASTLFRRHQHHRPLQATETVENETKSDFGSAMPQPAEVDPHDIIGVEPDKLALGINPDEFLEWVGT
jgi:hypothetical protein